MDAVRPCHTLVYQQKLETDTSIVMVAETVSLGVLSLPAAVAGLGLVPYVSCMKSVKGLDLGS